MKVVLAIVMLGLAVTLIDGCFDIGGDAFCTSESSFCQDAFFGEFVQGMCANTCGLCKREETLETREGCFDIGGDAFCTSQSSFCQDAFYGEFVQGMCANTCGLCNKREETLETRGVRGGKQEATLEGLMRRFLESKEKMAEHK